MDRKDASHHDNEKHRHSHHPLLDVESKMVYQDKHWRPLSEIDPMQIDNLVDGKSPVTQMKEGGQCDGVLHLSGSFLEKHKDEIMGIIHHMEANAKESDITNQIVTITEHAPDKMTVCTVKNQLAARMGKKVNESYKHGELKIHWSKDDMPVEVWWHKDL